MIIQPTIWWFWIIIYLILTSFMDAKELKVLKLVDGLHKPVYLTSPRNSSDTLFIIEQHGVIQILINGEISSLPLLNIRDRVHQSKMPGDERGLLGMALHPQFQKNGQLFVNYIDNYDNTIISRFEVDMTSSLRIAKTEQIILQFKQPYSNHNGGHLAFGPDGKLYIGVGDGGGAGDPYENGQNVNTIFGSILRLDVDQSFPYSIPLDNPFFNKEDARKEIWCYGPRNPWRFSFDRQNGDLYIGDVGQSNWEEINYTPLHLVSGTNFGWNEMEGSHCYPNDKDCDSSAFTPPVFEYPNNANYIKTLIGWNQNNAKGCSVTGGYVYRGTSIEELQGMYIFGDYCTGKLWSFRVEGGIAKDYLAWEVKDRKDEIYISSFGRTYSIRKYLLDTLFQL